jgi:hypothetical protein
MALESPATFNQASSYGAEQTRRAVLAWCARTAANTPGIISGGLLSASDCQISAPGSGLSVNISTGEAIVGGSEGGSQGGYGPIRVSSTTNLTISTANPSLPRIDTIALTIADSGYTEPTGVSGNAAVLQVVTGTATAGATLSNLTGKAALPASSLLLGYVLVPNGASNIITADILNVATTGLIGDTTLQSPNNGVRKLLLQGSAVAPGGTGPADYIFLISGALAGSAVNITPGVAAPMWVGDSGLSSQPKDFQVANKSAFGRVRAMLNPNGTSAGITATVGVYQVTGSGGPSGNIQYSFGSALAGSTVALSAGASFVGGESGQFALPSSNYYALGVNLSGTVPAAAIINISAQLYGYNA